MKAALRALLSIGMAVAAAGVHAAPDDATARAQALVAKLTLKEKVAQLQAGAPAILHPGNPIHRGTTSQERRLAKQGSSRKPPYH